MPILVNRVEITDEEVHQEMQYHPAGSVEEARHKAAQSLVIRQLLLQESIEKGLVERAAANDLNEQGIELVVDSLLRQEIKIPEANDETCERYYSQNEEKFTDKKVNKILPLEDVISQIRDYLHARSMQTGLAQYIKLLAGRYKIAGFEMEGSDSPLT